MLVMSGIFLSLQGASDGLSRRKRQQLVDGDGNPSHPAGARLATVSAQTGEAGGETVEMGVERKRGRCDSIPSWRPEGGRERNHKILVTGSRMKGQI